MYVTIVSCPSLRPSVSHSNGVGPSNFDVRLVTDTGVVNGNTGLVQIFFNGVWGTVCMNGFTDSAASVVCRQLGYANGSILAEFDHMKMDGVIWLDNVQCQTGQEETLDQCNHPLWGVHDCDHHLDVAVQCIDGEL